METLQAYQQQQHVTITKQYKQHSDAIKAREPYGDDFEKIYEKATKADVKLDNAKAFLEDFSPEERKTLQNYAKLVDEISVDSLSNEGAYNLLMHAYEKYDFNDDGIVENGIAKISSIVPAIPQNMDSGTKQAYTNAMNSLDKKDRLLASMTLSIDPDRRNHNLAKHFQNMSAAKRADIQQYATFDIDQFVLKTLSEPYHPKPATYESITNRAETLINPPPQSYSSPELKNALSQFLEAFQAEYAQIKNNAAQQSTVDVLASRQNVEPTQTDKSSGALQSALKSAS